jgi:hypothetical protein
MKCVGEGEDLNEEVFLVVVAIDVLTVLGEDPLTGAVYLDGGHFTEEVDGVVAMIVLQAGCVHESLRSWFERPWKGRTPGFRKLSLLRAAHPGALPHGNANIRMPA